MKNWEIYLSRQRDEYLQPAIQPDFTARLAVVIPCYDERSLTVTLHSLLNCEAPDTGVVVLVVINSGVNTDSQIISRNRETYREAQAFSEKFSTGKMLFVPVMFENLPRKHAGVGLARKIGMDLAVDYFRRTANSRGILVSLDADCTVSENYLRQIHDVFVKDEKCCCTVHNFHHRAENGDAEIENAIRQYENYIRYYENALNFTGFPYYFHTIGSAFAVTADAYVRVGGMGRQQGGEDFYFLQKIFASGKTVLLNNVFVYPMARFSNRVPFGTGPALQKIIAEPDGEMKGYSIDAFAALKQLFDLKDSFFKQPEAVIEEKLKTLHPAIQAFIRQNEVLKDIADCNNNAAGIASFQKRFFHHFNAFRIVKFLNFAHPVYFRLEPVTLSVYKYTTSVGN